MLRFGLCCIFRDQPIKFRTTTAAAVSRLKRPQALAKISELCLANALALQAALDYCQQHAIGCFRLSSQILPLKTHPIFGYDVADLPGASEIIRRFQSCGSFIQTHALRASFHPDQFIVLSSPRSGVVESSLREIEYQAEVSQWIGADVINIHIGGAYDDKAAALAAFARNVNRLSDRARSRLTVENDDVLYAPRDLLPMCRSENVPLVYDVHHHRCNPDAMSVEAATDSAAATWNREPLFHVSSPIGGWKGPTPRRHHDFINVRDFPPIWESMRLTVEVEAKAKELAVSRLQRALIERQKRRASRCP